MSENLYARGHFLALNEKWDSTSVLTRPNGIGRGLRGRWPLLA